MVRILIRFAQAQYKQIHKLAHRKHISVSEAVRRLVRRGLGVAAFRALGEAVDSAMDVLWVDEELHHRAWKGASQVGRKGPSLVDFVGFLAMQALRVDTALCLDQHFRDQGFATLP